MKWIRLFILISVIVILVMTCVAHRSQEMASWYAPKETHQNQQIQAAIDILNDYPSAAGKEKKR